VESITTADPGNSQSSTIHLERTIDGYRFWKDKIFLLAVVTTRHFQGLARNNAYIYEPMPRSSWRVNLTSPSTSIGDWELITKNLPAEA
jgi:hypothetical protein